MNADYDRKSKQGFWLPSWYENKKQVLSLSGRRWYRLKQRTLTDGSYQKHFPTYLGSECLFPDFNTFVEWSRDEFGYNSYTKTGRLWGLDKDILSKGGKIYSPDTCLLFQTLLIPSSKYLIKKVHYL